MNIDQGLDAIIAKNKSKFSHFGKKRGGGGSHFKKRMTKTGVGHGHGKNRRHATEATASTSLRKTFPPRRLTQNLDEGPGPAIIHVSNLHHQVSKRDLQELFGEMGVLNDVVLHFNRIGEFLGTAEVTFRFKNNAIKAMNTYNNVTLDERPMNIRLVTEDPVGQANVVDSSGDGQQSRNHRYRPGFSYFKTKDNYRQYFKKAENAPPKKQLNRSDLDREMEDYMSQNKMDTMEESSSL